MSTETKGPRIIRFRPLTIFELISIAIGLAGLYIAWVSGGGAPGH